MAHLTDQFGRVLGPFAAGSGHPGAVPIPSFIIGPAPGDSDLGDIAGIVDTILQRIPIPRPRLPGPRVPGPTGPRGRIPIPIPIPFPSDIFGGGGGACPTCCKGEHIAKTTDQNSPSFGQCVKNRRMNALNPRALKRAIRRATAFERFVKSNRKSLRKLATI